MTKTLVAVFSPTGTTAHVAKTLAEATDADLFEIEPKVPYTSADLNWNDKHSRTSFEMAEESVRPPLVNEVEDMSQYDTVFVGFPIWWYVEPRIIDTFLESYDFTGKTIIPFATSGGSGLGKAPSRMGTLAPGAKVLQGALLNGNPNVAALRGWVEKLGL